MNKIDLCKKCQNRKFDLKQGVICGLTDAKPAFEEKCADFKADESVKEFQGFALRPNDQRASIVITFIWIVLIMEVVSFFSSFLQYNLLQTAADGGEITLAQANANDFREQAVAFIYLLAYIVSGITFIMWFRRAYYNLHQKVGTLAYSDGWAAGSWFVPIVNLYRPFEIMKELYVETKNYLLKKEDSPQLKLDTDYLVFWWTLWIVNAIIGHIAFRLSWHGTTVSQLMASTVLDMVSCVIGVILGLVTIKIVRDYVQVERLLVTR